MAVRTIKALDAAASRLEDLASDWAEVDEWFRVRLEEAAASLSVLRMTVEDVYPGRRKKEGAD